MVLTVRARLDLPHGDDVVGKHEVSLGFDTTVARLELQTCRILDLSVVGLQD
jgi:hypothetical protein